MRGGAVGTEHPNPSSRVVDALEFRQVIKQVDLLIRWIQEFLRFPVAKAAQCRDRLLTKPTKNYAGEVLFAKIGYITVFVY